MTLLKAYLMGSKDPFVLAKAFLEETLNNIPNVILKENKFNTQEWMNIFVESSKTIKDKPQMKAALRQLLNEEKINDALDEQVTYGAGSAAQGAGQFKSGMANYPVEDSKEGRKTQFKNVKLAKPAVRIQNLNRLSELLRPFESEYSQIQRIQEAINEQISFEETRESGSENKSAVEKELRKIIKAMLNKNTSPLRRYRSGKYPNNFIQLVESIKKMNIGLEDIQRISQGYWKEYTILEESKEWFREKLNTEIADKELRDHIRNAWKNDEEDPLDESDLNLFRDAMYDLIEEGGWKLETQKTKKHATTLKQARNLLSALERNFKTFTRLKDNGLDYEKILSSMSIEFTSLNTKFNSIKDKTNEEGKSLIPDELKEQLEDSIEAFNEAFEEYDVDVKIKSPMDKVTWVKRIAEDARGYADTNKSIIEALKDSNIKIEGLEHLGEVKGMSKSELNKYVDARLPTIDKADYAIIEDGKIKGFDEDKYRQALEDRKDTIDKVVSGEDIYRRDLLWLLPKRKIPKNKPEVLEEDEGPKEDKYTDDDMGGGIGGA